MSSNFIWAALLILSASLTQTGCISDNSNPALPLDPSADLEKVLAESADFPLENLRMDPTTLKMLADLRSATAKYHRMEVAEDDGYSQATPCISHPNLGSMGYHFVNFDLVDGIFDPTQPEALLYEMDQEGNMKLVAVEFIVVTEAWEEEEIPHFGSQIFDIALAPTPLPFDNYQLHVWVWKNNPSGIFTKFNPKVKCGENGSH
ncbi:hypothetical protein D0X99_06260 [Algoriphagus lacus]|uniref:Uncharacterized protein n=1 Tax=Algoriphagus lacus TaxID=2056311 RepID=A0A418PUJ9_9BACT|nr:hypothetical protein [Algoriphagus lacus]RIW17338.1 hypothetical protein D0X99_06260 [Algoriphagus lacus]